MVDESKLYQEIAKRERLSRKEAERLLVESREMIEASLAEDPDDLDLVKRMASVHGMQAALYAVTRRREQATEEFSAALKIIEKLVEDYPHIPTHRRQLAQMLASAGQNAMVSSRNERAGEHFASAVEHWERLFAQQTVSSRDDRLWFAGSLHMVVRNELVAARLAGRDLASLDRSVFELDARAEGLLDLILAEDPEDRETIRTMIEVCQQRAESVSSGCCDGDAEALSTRAVDLARKLVATDPGNFQFELTLANALDFRSHAHARENRREAAIVDLEEAMSLEEAVFKVDPTPFLEMMLNSHIQRLRQLRGEKR